MKLKGSVIKVVVCSENIMILVLKYSRYKYIFSSSLKCLSLCERERWMDVCRAMTAVWNTTRMLLKLRNVQLEVWERVNGVQTGLFISITIKLRIILHSFFNATSSLHQFLFKHWRTVVMNPHPLTGIWSCSESLKLYCAILSSLQSLLWGIGSFYENHDKSTIKMSCCWSCI